MKPRHILLCGAEDVTEAHAYKTVGDRVYVHEAQRLDLSSFLATLRAMQESGVAYLLTSSQPERLPVTMTSLCERIDL